ncbi:MAG: histidine kinase [Gemmatimonadaceae bacterium]|jgi:sensor histidine kinase YesM|nr:histidine kinase [Gemmatimonadaceae bacterium]
MTDDGAPIDRPAWIWIALTVVGCAFIGIAPQAHAFEVIGVADAPMTAVRWQAGVAGFWLVAAVPLARRWSLADREGRALVALGALAMAVSIASAWAAYLLLDPTGPYARRMMLVELVSGALPIHALTAALLSLVGSWTNGRRQRARAADREALLAAHATRAELDGLRERVQPHFVLNALNTIAALARRGDGERAGDVAADLGEVLQFSLASAGDAVAFDSERVIVERYVAIEQARFGDRLDVQWHIDPAVRTTRVPALSWQPVVENAIRHGIARRTRPGVLRLEAYRGAEHVRLVVDADGAESAAAADSEPDAPFGGLGIGEATLERRLALLFGDRASVARVPRAGGMRTEVRIPLGDAT